MDVTAIATTPSQTTPTAKLKVSDYDTFLKMMTTQIKNQDPLNPMSANDFAVQLATFSGVEQQTKTNALLTQQLAQSALGSMAQVVGWVGKEARIAAPVQFDGAKPVTLSPNPAVGATKAVLVTKDASGVEVSRTEIPAASTDYEWQGLDSQGNPLPKGVYDLSLESYQGDTLLGSTAVEYYGRISEIRNSTSGVTAMFAGGVEVSTALVTALREPG
ncbi:MAG: flagellar hook capping FlgD N-terminal domain-containing protein [Paracoccaceae bacterium]